MITIWKIRALLIQRGVTADEDRDFLLRDDSDGTGPFIAEWDDVKLGAKPTEADLDALQTEADALRTAAISPRQKIIKRLRSDPILKAQVIDSFEARGITDKQQMLAALEAKFADTI